MGLGFWVGLGLWYASGGWLGLGLGLGFGCEIKEQGHQKQGHVTARWRVN